MDPDDPYGFLADLCDEHEWAGYGECPGCKAVRLANESVDRVLFSGNTKS